MIKMYLAFSCLLNEWVWRWTW